MESVVLKEKHLFYNETGEFIAPREEWIPCSLYYFFDECALYGKMIRIYFTKIRMFCFSGILLCVFTLLSSTISLAAEPIIIGPGFSERNIGTYTEYLRDDSGDLTINQVASPKYADRFTPHKRSSFNLGMNRAHHWIRFKITLDGPHSIHLPTSLFIGFDNPCLEQVTLYVPIGSGKTPQFQELRAGWEYTEENQITDSTYPAFQLPSTFGDSGVFYARIQSPYALAFQVLLFSGSGFQHSNLLNLMALGLIFGVFISMLFYNLMIAVFTRDKIYFYYSLYLSAYFPYQLSREGFVTIISPSMGYFLTENAIIPCLISYCFIVMFTRSFLVTSKYAVWHDHILKVLLVISFIGVLLGVGGWRFEANCLAHIIALIFIPVILSAPIAAFISGFKAARYFLVAWLVLASGAAVFIARSYGFLPQHFLTTHAAGIAGALESILFTLAIGDRLRILTIEKELHSEKEQRLTQLSITDNLTGLFNRRYLESKCVSEIQHARRLKQDLSIIVIDVDSFKWFNDTYGHIEGDKVLSKLGTVISENVRDNDIPCRYGGEEFVVLLPGVDAQGSASIGERIRKTFMNIIFTPAPDSQVSVTVSLGVTQMREREKAKAFFTRADKALYQAKSYGRNQTVVY